MADVLCAVLVYDVVESEQCHTSLSQDDFGPTCRRRAKAEAEVIGLGWLDHMGGVLA